MILKKANIRDCIGFGSRIMNGDYILLKSLFYIYWLVDDVSRNNISIRDTLYIDVHDMLSTAILCYTVDYTRL